MNIPESVKIGWRTYKINQAEHRTNENGADLYGEINYDGNTIYIYDKQDDDNKAVTLLHEIIHGILYFAGRGERKDEGLIICLSENLYQVIKDNPDMFYQEKRPKE